MSAVIAVCVLYSTVQYCLLLYLTVYCCTVPVSPHYITTQHAGALHGVIH